MTALPVNGSEYVRQTAISAFNTPFKHGCKRLEIALKSDKSTGRTCFSGSGTIGAKEAAVELPSNQTLIIYG